MPSRQKLTGLVAGLLLFFSAAFGHAQAGAGGMDSAMLARQLSTAAPDLDLQVLVHAVAAMQCATSNGTPAAERLAVIDFSLPSSERRLWLFDLQDAGLLLNDLVAHGQGSGDNLARQFSNIEGSHQSSIGLFRTAESYYGQHGYSLRMDGLEPGINDQARRRAIVIHGADYVDESWVEQYGRIGRSHGCPAVNPEISDFVVDSLKDGQFLFAWYPDVRWLQTSAVLNCPGARQQELLAMLAAVD